jgi:hypothetical protein
VADVSGVITAVEAETGQSSPPCGADWRIAQDGPRDMVFSVPEDKVAAVKASSDVYRACLGRRHGPGRQGT